VRVVLTDGIPGALVECGTWRGGSSLLMAELFRQADQNDRKVWMFDSFEGIPSPQDIDGPAARAWATETSGPMYFDNLRTPVDEVKATASALGLAERVVIEKGWFDQTLPHARQSIGPIALLRIDADWYASVLCVLEQLFGSVVEGGLIILDDYYTYDGCAAAVHEFLGQRKLPHRIESFGAGPEPLGAVIRKGEPGWQSMRHAYLFVQELAKLSLDGTPIALVDDNSLHDLLIKSGIPARTFPEHQGQYWGKPADDDDAIQHFERLCAAGAGRIVFAWHSFWWLEFYKGFARHLRDRCRCIADNEYLIAFEFAPAGAAARTGAGDHV
jgi:O-methyltransferase